jgi:pSer/pThr/pTyr-binding forkhead associated (FHA) protein
MSEGDFCLVIQRGPNPDSRLPLTPEQFSIGRDETNHLSLNDSEISRFHARVIHTDNGYYLVDMDSMNGTYHNGLRVKKALLTPGDRIGIGESIVLVFDVMLT